jgi:EmrB/QacA subfamily drug resistance transporter
LAIICGGVFISMMQNTTINLANPDIMKDFGVGMTTVEWVLTANMLAYTSFIVLMGRLGDAVGRKKMFVLGLVGYMLGGFLAGIAPSIGFLIASSALQGLGASAMMPATTSLIAANFDKDERGGAMGAWGAVTGLAVVVGPLIGGALAQNGLGPAINALLGVSQGWRYIFFMSSFLGLVVLALTLPIIPESKDESTVFAFDLVGVLLSAGSLFFLTFGLINGAKHYGWLYKNEAMTIGSFTLNLGKWSPTPILLAVAVLLGAIFVVREGGKKAPLFDASLFKNRDFAGGTIVTAVLQFAMMGTFFLMPFFLKSVLGLDSFKAGLAMVPMALAVMVVSPIAGILSDKIGAKWVIVAGMLFMSFACFFIARLSPATTIGSLILPFVLLGIGIGLPMSPSTSSALRDVPVEKVGGASGTLSMVRQIGAILGIALIATAFGTAMPTNLQKRVAAMSAPEARLERKFDRVKAMMLEGMKGSGSEMSSDMSQYNDRLSLFFPNPTEAGEVGATIKIAVLTGMADSMNDAFKLAAIAPLLGAFAALFMGGRRAKKAEGDDETAGVDPLSAQG